MGSGDAPARGRAVIPAGVERVLSARSLPSAFPRLVELLRPGMDVLDVGCGTGAITAGIAGAVAPGGRVVGVDVNPDLLRRAERDHGGRSGRSGALSFRQADVYDLPYDGVFDVVAAARLLQWLADPLAAVRSMARAVRPGGLVAALDYNHENLAWEPAPPPTVRRFYDSFLRWRADTGMDNSIADRLPDVYARAGLADVRVTPQHEVALRGEPEFAARLRLWEDVIASRGIQMVGDGYLDAAERVVAEADYRAWARDEATSLRHYLLCVEGRRSGIRLPG